MRRISARSVVQRALLCALAMLLALAPISGAAAATMDEADVLATEAAAAQEGATEQAEVAADPTEDAEPSAGDPTEPPPAESTEPPPSEPTETEADAAVEDQDVKTEAKTAESTEADEAAVTTTAVEDEAELEAAAAHLADGEAGPASSGGVQPIFMDGNPTCGGLYPNEIKVEPVRSGTYTKTFTSGGGSFTASVTISVNGGAQTFSFSGATPPVGAVVVKGGDNANLYTYAGGAVADSGLHAPVNPSNGQYYGLSHISFCFPPFTPDVDIEKWVVDNSGADRETHAIVSGSTVTWKIRVTNTGTQNLTNVVVTDPRASSCDRSIGNLAAGAAPVTYTCTSTDVTAGFTNVAKVTTGQGVDDTDDASVTVLRPDISITKSPKNQEVAYGGTATWTIVVENTGEVPLTGVAVTDEKAPDCAFTIGNLAVGAQAKNENCTLDNVTEDFRNIAVVNSNEVGPKQDHGDVTVPAPALDASWGCPTPGQGSVITGTTNVPLSSVTLTFARNGGTQTITTTQTGAFTFEGTGANAGKVISSAQIVSSVSSLNRTVTPTQEQIDACYDRPAISIEKSPVGWDGTPPETQQVTSGEAAHWTITVTNTGDVALTNVRVTDPLASDCELTGAEAFSLGIGGSRTYVCDKPNVVAGFVNTATATGTSPLNKDVSDSDDSPVTVFTPALTAAWGCPTPGQGSVITGTTNVPLSSVTLTFARNGGTQTITTTQTGAFTFEGTGANAGKVISSAQIVSSVSSLNRTVTPTQEQVDACYNSPGITIVKSPAEWNGAPPETQQVMSGQAASWMITVTNTGDVALTNVRVTDPLAADCELTGAQAFSLAIGASRVYNCSRPDVTAGFTNVATATGTPPTGGDVSDSDDSPVTVAAALSPAIAIIKAHTITPLVDGQTIDAGGTATWVIRVTNTGNTTLNNVTVTDPLAPGCDRNLGSLAAGASADAYPCSLAGVPVSFTNRADVVGTSPANTQVTASDTAPVTVLTTTGGGSPGISLIKTVPTPECPRPGDSVIYRFEIRNTGDQTLTEIALNDPLLGGAVTLPGTTLPAGQTMVATEAYTLTAANIDAGQLANSATVSSRAPSGLAVNNTGQAMMMLEPCADVLLEKDGPATAAVGEQITYTFTVTNTGNVTLTNVRIFDERLGISGLLVNPSTLAPNQEGAATATYTVTEADGEAKEILNTAFVRGRTPDGTEVDDEDDHLVPVPFFFEAPDPAISLEKDGPSTANVGDTVTYRFTVTNTGETTLTNVSITDPFLGLERLAVRPSTLAVDEQGTATATYVITAADGEAGSVYNTAVARGRAPDTRIVRDRDDHTVPVPGPPLCVSPPCGPPPPPPELPATGVGTTGFALTALLSLALGGVLLGVAGSGNLQAAMANSTVNADSPMLAMLRRWNLAPKPGGSQARRRRRR